MRAAAGFGAGRSAQNERLRGGIYDVLVIGGGITGAGVALDAAVRGLRVALVERRDFASGTSRWSTKLVHGGIRYLPQLDIGLVREALVERGLLLRNAPRLVEPLLFVLPIYQYNRHPLGLQRVPPAGPLLVAYLELGLFAYDLLAGRLNIEPHRRLNQGMLRELAPLLRTDGLLAAYGYFDARTDDARLVMNVLETARQYGAVLCNYCEVVGFERSRNRLRAAQVRDVLTGDEFVVQAKLFVNATGIWGEELERKALGAPTVHIAPSKGVHLVLPQERVGVEDAALVIPETSDGRLLFVVPHDGLAILGTTDTGAGPLDDPLASDADVDFLLEHANRYLEVHLTRADVISVYAGYRPLIRRGLAETTARLSRSHELIEHESGLVSILGGKLTTYRRMAEETVDRIQRRLGQPVRHPTRHLMLAGREGLETALPAILATAQELGVERSVPWLLQAYGTRAQAVLELAREEPQLARPIVPGLPYLFAEVIHACRNEMAQRLEDVLERRTWVLFADRGHGLASVAEVAQLMARELGWDEEDRAAEITAYRERVLHLCGSEVGIATQLSGAAEEVSGKEGSEVHQR